MSITKLVLPLALVFLAPLPAWHTLRADCTSVFACWTFAANWSLGGQIRYSSWFLPEEPERLPTGDLASLKGRIDMFDFGLSIAYRIAL